MIANIQPQGNHVFATITGKETKPATKFGVRISKSLYWFTVDNWSAFKLAVGFQETSTQVINPKDLRPGDQVVGFKTLVKTVEIIDRCINIIFDNGESWVTNPNFSTTIAINRPS